MLCHFVYTYLLYNISYAFKSEEGNLVKIYQSVLRFIKLFAISKHPLTISWLLEILYILSAKFNASSVYKNDKKLRSEYNELVNQLLTNTAQILSDSFNI